MIVLYSISSMVLYGFSSLHTPYMGNMLFLFASYRARRLFATYRASRWRLEVDVEDLVEWDIVCRMGWDDPIPITSQTSQTHEVDGMNCGHVSEKSEGRGLGVLFDMSPPFSPPSIQPIGTSKQLPDLDGGMVELVDDS